MLNSSYTASNFNIDGTDVNYRVSFLIFPYFMNEFLTSEFRYVSRNYKFIDYIHLIEVTCSIAHPKEK